MRSHFAQQGGQFLRQLGLAVGGLAAPQLADQIFQLRLFKPHRVLDGDDFGARIHGGVRLANHAAAQRLQPKHRARKELRGAVVEIARDRFAHPAHRAIDRNHLRQPRPLLAFECAPDFACRSLRERQLVEARIGQIPQQQSPGARIAGDRHRDPAVDTKMRG